MKKFTTQIKLILVISGEYFSISELTNLIKISPTQSWIKGDTIPLQKGIYRKDNKIRIRNNTVWEFSTGFVKTLDFENLSNQFEKVFNNKITTLKYYIQEKKLESVINIVVEVVDEEKPSIHFNKRIVKIFEELGAEIDIDMYIFNND
jgi:hypothetical protein